MSIFSAQERHRVPRLDLELTQACDHRCRHCYNVWGERDRQSKPYPRGQLATEAYLKMMRKAIVESGAAHVTLTGGEPLLRPDALDIVGTACELAPSVELITNGSHVTAELARELASLGLRCVQLTLLAARRELHDRLKGATSFDDTLRAVCNLRDAGIPVQACFVALRENAGELAQVLELCLALGIGSLAYNRLTLAGAACPQQDALMPPADQVEADLEVAERLGRRWQIRVATAMPVPPCLIRLERYPWVRFGFCSTGSRSPNVVIDPLGNVRSCNLSSQILGNVLEQSWAQVMNHPYIRRFVKTLPAVCRRCHYRRFCRGGCKESGLATFGSLEHPEPFLEQHLAGRGRRTAAGAGAR